MEISVPSSAARTRTGSAIAGQCSSPRDQRQGAVGPIEPGRPSRRRSKTDRLIAVSNLPDEVPIIDRERQLVAACLGDLMNQILSEPK
jgi:hypothetical protein